MAYYLHILIMINIYILLILGMNLLLGYTNLLSLCQAAFYGIGAYLTVFALVNLNLSLIPALALVFTGTIITSLLISLPSLRLHGDYFILVTLGFMMVVFSVMYNWVGLTNGPYGISGIPKPTFLWLFKIDGIPGYAVFTTILSILSIAIFKILVHSPFGRVLQGIRDDEILVESMGRNVFAFKVLAFAISAAFASAAGFVYATYVTYIDPTSFTLDESIFILSAAIIGGTGNIIGTIVGAIFVIIIPEIIRAIQIPDTIAPNVRQIIYGLLLIILMYYRPKGLLGKYEFKK
jgi:branched-chain amino acid transport system permease protein